MLNSILAIDTLACDDPSILIKAQRTPSIHDAATISCDRFQFLV